MLSFKNNDLKFAAIYQLWKLLSGFILLTLAPLYLSPIELGYWYTFISLAALVFFADMGFSTICLQFSAHEFAFLRYRNGWVVGPAIRREQLASFWSFTKTFSIAVGFAALPIILSVGYWVLESQSAQINWLPAWLLYAAASVFIFINGMLLSFIEGCDRVADVQKTRLEISVVTLLAIGFLLAMGFHIYALAFATSLGAAFGWMLTIFRFRKFMSQLNGHELRSQYAWWDKIKPLISKYAISWTCGYLIFSLYTPIAFFYFGDVHAGRIGFSLSISSAIFSISNVWITIITPKINMLVSVGNYKKLNLEFFEGVKKAIATYILGCLIVVSYLLIADENFPFINRMVDPKAFFILLFAWLLQLIISSCATYMRAHKEEPLLGYSLFSAIYVSITTILIAKSSFLNLYFLGYLSSFVITLPWVLILYYQYFKRGDSIALQ